MSEKEAAQYEAAVGLEILRNLAWQKVPGKDEIMAEFPKGENTLIMQAVVAANEPMTRYFERNHIANDGEENPLFMDESIIVLRGRNMLRAMVNVLGLDFSHADTYRDKKLGR